MPSGQTYEILKDTILRLSERYSTPGFEPHITIIGGLRGPVEELVSKSAILASAIKPHKIVLAEPECLDEFYRCLFLTAEATPELLRTNLDAKRIFERTGESEYSPHLSLMYCDFKTDIKEKIIGELGELKAEFEVDRLHLYLTEGEATEWRAVRSFNLSGQKIEPD